MLLNVALLKEVSAIWLGTVEDRAVAGLGVALRIVADDLGSVREDAAVDC
jgi:hypothetical protein